MIPSQVMRIVQLKPSMDIMPKFRLNALVSCGLDLSHCCRNSPSGPTSSLDAPGSHHRALPYSRKSPRRWVTDS